MACVRAGNWCLDPPGIRHPESSPRRINLSCLCPEQHSIQGRGRVAESDLLRLGLGRAPRGFSGQLSPCSRRSFQLASLDFRLWCLQSAEVLFRYQHPFWTYVCSITLLKYSENQTHYLLFSNDSRCYSHIFPPLNSALHTKLDLLLAVSLSYS